LQAWRAQNAPVVNHLAPGLTADEIDALEREHGVELPGELRDWWGWHDGATTGMVSGPPSEVGAGPWTLMSLGEALDTRRSQLDLNDRPFPADQADWESEWAPWFLPVVTVGNAWLFADLNAAADGHAPIHLWAHTPEDVFAIQAPSWTQVVTTWAEALEAGHFTWSPAAGEWVWADVLPPEVERLL
jgi:cell wall assembly regulator SMI1